jgi:hypothetical protein
MDILLDGGFWIGAVFGGAFIWLFRAWVEKRKKAVEAKIKKIKK